MNRVRHFVVFVSLVVVLSFPSCGGQDSGFEIEQLAVGDGTVSAPSVWGDRVAWAGSDDTDGGDDLEIFTWTPADGVVQVTHNDIADGYPIVSGNRVVWTSRDHVDDQHDTELFTWTPDDGVVQITADEVDVVSYSASEGRVVWQVGEHGAAAINTWTPADGITLLADHGHWYRPKVSGDRVVWWGWNGNDDEGTQIYTWTRAEGTVQLSYRGCSGAYPEVSGDRVVWSGDGGSDGGEDREVFTWTPTEGVLQITRDDYDDALPLVAGDRVVWNGDGFGVGILTWTPDSGIVEVVKYDDHYVSSPSVSEGRVVWAEDISAAGSDIFTWTPENGSLRLTSSESPDFGPQVSGDRIVWVGYRREICQIFTAQYVGR